MRLEFIQIKHKIKNLHLIYQVIILINKDTFNKA